MAQLQVANGLVLPTTNDVNIHFLERLKLIYFSLRSHRVAEGGAQRSTSYTFQGY